MVREVLSIRNLVKYINKCVLDDISFMVFEGEILGIVGVHGAGISALTGILSGCMGYDSGTIMMEGRPVSFGSRSEANRAGVYRIDKTSLLVADMTVAENICLTHPPVTRSFPVSRRSIRQKAREILDSYGLNISVDKRAYELSDYERDAIEVVKVTMHRAKVLILDNVMLNYSPLQRTQMKQLINLIASMGIAVIIVSNEAESIVDVAERLIVFSHGQIEGNFQKKDFNEKVINALMAPHSQGGRMRIQGMASGEEVLRLENIRMEDRALPDIRVLRGETIGLLDGRGQLDKSLIHALRGIHAYQGRIYIGGQPVEIRNVRDSLNLRIAYLTAYDSPEMLQENLSIEDNFLLLEPKKYAHFGFINQRMKRFASREYIKNTGFPVEMLKFFPGDLNAHARNKVNLIKLRAMRPKILLLDDPFINADAAMKTEIYSFIEEMLRSGVCIIAAITAEEEWDVMNTRIIRI